MAAPVHLLDHPPLKVTNLFEVQCAETQNDVLNLLTLIWNVESAGQLIDSDLITVTANEYAIESLRLGYLSSCHSRGLIGSAYQIHNNQGRSIPLVEELFFSLHPKLLAASIHSLFLEPNRTCTLCIVALDEEPLREEIL